VTARREPPDEETADLAEVQRWLLRQITQQPDVAGAPGDWSVDEVVGRSRALSADERLAVYQNAYVARLVGVLREDYPIVCRALGEELFDRFAVDYLRAHPPTSDSLGRLAEKWVSFLEQSRPDAARAAGDSPDWTDYLIDLARLEGMVNRVFDGPGDEETPPLEVERLRLLSAEAFTQSRIVLARSLQLVSLRFPLHEHFSALVRGEQSAIPDPGPQVVAVWRRDYRVRRLPVDPAAARLLTLLGEGRLVGDALGWLIHEQPSLAPQLGTLLPAWFQGWGQRGWILGLEQVDSLTATTGEAAPAAADRAGGRAAGPIA
jgi:hypothetical protein